MLILMRLNKEQLWNILLALSAGFAGLLVVNANLLDISRLKLQVLLFVLMVVASYLLIRIVDVRAKVIGLKLTNLQQAILGVLTVYSLYVTIHHYLSYIYQAFPDHINVVLFARLGIFSVLGVFAVFIAWKLFVWGVVTLYKKLNFSSLEKRLISIYSLIVFLIAIFLSLFVTNVFVLKLNIVDTVYAMDSSALMHDEIYDNNVTGLNTDVRHPTAQSISTPMGIVARVTGQVLHFIPYAQQHVLQLFTIIMIAVTGVLIIRLLALKKASLQIFGFIGYVCLYSSLIFTLAFEQYVPSVFFLVLFVYGMTKNWSLKWNIFFLIASAGYIITSAFAGLAFLLKKGRPMSRRIYDLVLAGIAFLLVVIASGKVLTLVFAGRQLSQISEFSGASFVEKLNQFTNFLASTIMPGYHTTYFDGVYWKYKTAEVAIHQVNFVGIVVLVLALTGLWFARKSYFARVAALWAGFSFIVCVLVGWGSAMNEMALYSFYFGWSIYSLVFLGIFGLISLFVKRNRQRRLAMVALITVVSLVNIGAYYDIIGFAHRNYPAESLKIIVSESLRYKDDQ